MTANQKDMTYEEILVTALELPVAERLLLIEMLARSLRQELEDEMEWDRQFARTKSALKTAVKQVKKEIEADGNESLDIDRL